MIIVMTIGFIILMACIVAVANHLNKKIDMLDEAVYQYMKEEHNARVEDYIPRDYYEKVVEALCEKHTQEIAEQTEPKCEECEHYGHKVKRCLLNKCKYE